MFVRVAWGRMVATIDGAVGVEGCVAETEHSEEEGGGDSIYFSPRRDHEAGDDEAEEKVI